LDACSEAFRERTKIMVNEDIINMATAARAKIARPGRELGDMAIPFCDFGEFANCYGGTVRSKCFQESSTMSSASAATRPVR
jgi:hypothetical protein